MNDKSPSTTTPVVHIVDDDDSIRDSLRMFFKSFNIETNLYHSAQDFLNNHQITGPSCVLLDQRMPQIDGLQLLNLLQEKNIRIPVIMMTGYGEVATAVRAMKAGAVDFVEKPFDHDYLLTSIYRSIDRHKQHQNNVILQKSCANRVATLTRREREVFDLITEGLINKVVADKLGISTRTVEAHRAKIIEKLEANTLSDLVRISIITAATQTK
ncbi:MAG: response regulator [Gammaproteobacteria bacterium]|jgi:FixJ family two-component response regulator